MNWLAQNWVWVAIAATIAWLVFRGGVGHRASRMPGGMDHIGHGSGPSGEVAGPASSTTADGPEAAIDPVSGDAVRTSDALASIHEGRIYYFASKENRDRFEAAPQEYAHRSAGQPVRSEGGARSHRHHGC